MQLARNLYTGHARTLSRKGQEVVLAWILEHLTGVSKDRLLEIYLNIIEWGPGIHGADEAARFYFDRDAHDLTLDQSLFLATVIPSPSRWRWRLDATGTAAATEGADAFHRPRDDREGLALARGVAARGFVARRGGGSGAGDRFPGGSAR